MSAAAYAVRPMAPAGQQHLYAGQQQLGQQQLGQQQQQWAAGQQPQRAGYPVGWQGQPGAMPGGVATAGSVLVQPMKAGNPEDEYWRC